MKKNKWVVKSLILMIFMGAIASCTSSRNVQKPQEPTVTLQQLSPEQQRTYEYFFLEASRLKAKNEYSAAFDLYKHCLAICPSAASALYEISQYYQYLGQPAMSQQALEQAVANAPENYWYNQALSNLYQQQNKTTEAIDLLEKMTIRFPYKQETLFALIDLYNKKEDYDRVISTLNRMEERMGKNEQISMEKFRIYLQKKDDTKAFQEIENLVKEYPLDTRYLTILGDVYMQNGKQEKAHAIYEQVLAKDPANPMAQISLASYYETTKQDDLYYQQLDTILLNKEVSADLKISLMRQFISAADQGKRDSTQIIALFDRIITQDIDDTNIPMLYAQYLLSKNMEKESVPVLEHILQLDPSNTAARMTLLGTAIRKNDYEWVIRICRPGVEVTPDVIEFYFYLGIAYYQEKRYDEALETYDQALDHVTEQTKKEVVSDFYSMIGDIRHTKNQMKEAYAAYDSALVYNPENVGALNNYAYYLSLERHDLDRAEEMSYKTVKAEPNNATYLDTYAWILFEKNNFAQARLFIDDALKNGGEESDVVVEHAGDIYFMSGDTEGALRLWKKAHEMGSESKTLKQKIEKKKYIPEKK